MAGGNDFLPGVNLGLLFIAQFQNVVTFLIGGGLKPEEQPVGIPGLLFEIERSERAAIERNDGSA